MSEQGQHIYEFQYELSRAALLERAFPARLWDHLKELMSRPWTEVETAIGGESTPEKRQAWLADGLEKWDETEGRDAPRVILTPDQEAMIERWAAAPRPTRSPDPGHSPHDGPASGLEDPGFPARSLADELRRLTEVTTRGFERLAAAVQEIRWAAERNAHATEAALSVALRTEAAELRSAVGSNARAMEALLIEALRAETTRIRSEADARQEGLTTALQAAASRIVAEFRDVIQANCGAAGSPQRTDETHASRGSGMAGASGPGPAETKRGKAIRIRDVDDVPAGDGPYGRDVIFRSFRDAGG